MRKKVIIFLIVIIVMVIAFSYYFQRGGSQFANNHEYDFDHTDLTITQDTFFHIRSYRVIQPLSLQNATIVFTLDSPGPIKLDTAYPPAAVLLSAIEITKMNYCLYNLKAQKLIALSNPSK